MVRHSKTSESWKKLPWKKFRKNLFRLQKRVYKAVRTGDIRKAKSLQKLILKSTSAKLLAIRQVTQLNTGKRTTGIDGKKALTFKERFELLTMLNQASDWRHQGLREIPIPKKNGKTRILKVPTISDRAWQCLAKYALEPAHEATFHPNSFGFRTGRSAHDAQKWLFHQLKSSSNGNKKRILEIDIKKCFDRINHSTVLKSLIAPRNLKLGISRCLKAGVNPEFPEQGMPQGGVVSPLLANIALNGIEEVQPSTIGRKIKMPHGYQKNGAPKFRYPRAVSAVRYADDMIFVIKDTGYHEDNRKQEEQLLEAISEFLNKRGMELSQEKTKLTKSTDGFDFLGWNFRVQRNGKFRCTPSKDNFAQLKIKVKSIINSSNMGSNEKANKLAPIIRGWRNYHRYCKMDGARNTLWFINHRAFRVFNKEKRNDRHSTEKLIKIAFPNVPYSQNAFVNVKGDKSPYDGDFIYWSKRESKLYDGATSRKLKKQSHKCGHCGMTFMPGERIHLHHIDGNHDNWKDKNLVAIHKSCHQYIHMEKHSES